MRHLVVCILAVACGPTSPPPVDHPRHAPPAEAPAPAATPASTASAPTEKATAPEASPPTATTAAPTPPPVVELPEGSRYGAARTAISTGELPPGAVLEVPWRVWLTTRGGGPLARVVVMSRTQPAPQTRIAAIEDVDNGPGFGPLRLGSFTAPFALPAVPLKVTATANYVGGSELVIELAPSGDAAARPIVFELTYGPLPSGQLGVRVTGPDGATSTLAPDA